MLVKMETGASGGGGAKSDTITLTASQTTTISTGLSSVNNFVISSGFLNGSYTYAIYDKNVNSSKYSVGGWNTETAIAETIDVGTSPTYPMRSIKINSISGGDVSITTFSNSAWNGDYTWFAK